MTRFAIAVALLPLFAGRLLASEPDPQHVLAKLPVKEITVFKDGHAFLLHEGNLPTDASGNVLIDHLPAPVIGTFWPYTVDKNIALHSVTAGRRAIRVERTALTLRELVEANPNAEVFVHETTTYPATILGFLERSSAELAATLPAGSDEQLPQKSNLLQLKTADGIRIVPFERVQDIRFLGKYSTRQAQNEFRNLLTMHIDWKDKKPAKEVEVGMAYLQKGIRWIPSYRVEIDGKSKAVVKLQATLLNELTDLEDVTVNLVVGVPSFMFKDTLDPLALSQHIQQTAAQLSQYFETNSRTAHGLSNAMMTQTARGGEHHAQHAAPAPAREPNLGPDVASSGKSEDLYIYTVKKVTLKKGQRMVLPVSQITMDYKDVYTLELPFAPPPEQRRSLNPTQAEELARLLNAPKVMHKIRLENPAKTSQPLTTAPALIVKENRVLAQGMMTYTAAGASTDLALTTAIDVKVKKTDKEIKRTPNAANWHGTILQRIELEGGLQLSNFGGKEMELEVVRHVLGNVDEAGKEGKVEMVNVLEDGGYFQSGNHPYWWGWYSWPGWWTHYNGIGRITWKVKIEQGKTVDLTYKWNYYWQ